MQLRPFFSQIMTFKENKVLAFFFFTNFPMSGPAAVPQLFGSCSEEEGKGLDLPHRPKPG